MRLEKEDISIKISIIIPVYNSERYLEECLNSVISQTIEKKEILCIDDGSKDKSYNILKQYQKQYPYIRIFRQDNKGAGEARNVGLREATGKYICFLDADDFYLDPEALKKMACACERSELQACAGLRKLYKDGLLEDFFWSRELFKKERDYEEIVLDYRENPDDYFYTNYIFALEIIKRNKILFPQYRRYEDPPFFLRVMLLINRYMILPVEFYGYRFPEEALERKETYIEDVLKGIRDNIKIAKENQLDKLEKILVDRISLEYVPGIIRSASREIMGLLQEIRIMTYREKGGRGTTESQTVLLDNIITLVKFKLEGYGIGNYLEEKGITTVAIYGLGRYGRFIIEEIKRSTDIILYGIDQKIKEMYEIEVGTLNEINKKSNIIIITPAKENEKLVSDIRNIWEGTVWGWNTLISNMEKK
ncbi:glycosyltransferase [Lachnospiraceae bacterium 56-18]